MISVVGELGNKDFQISMLQQNATSPLNIIMSSLSVAISLTTECWKAAKDITTLKEDMIILKGDVTKDIATLKEEVVKDRHLFRKEISEKIEALHQNNSQFHQSVTKSLLSVNSDIRIFQEKALDYSERTAATYYKSRRTWIVLGTIATSFAAVMCGSAQVEGLFKSFMDY